MKTTSEPELSPEIDTAETVVRNYLPGRRHVLTAAGSGLIAAAALVGTASAAPSTSVSVSAVPGGWNVTRHDASTPVAIHSIFTFSDGGAAAGLDLEPIAPPYLGSWAALDAHRFALTFWTAITDDQGLSIGTARVKATGRVDGHDMSGTYTAVAFIQGHRVNDSGTFQGTRIDPD